MTDSMYGTTQAGTPITDALVTQFATEAEAGYPIAAVRPRRRGRPALAAGEGASDALPVRLDSALRSALNARSEADHVSAGETVRRALREYLGLAG